MGRSGWRNVAEALLDENCGITGNRLFCSFRIDEKNKRYDMDFDLCITGGFLL